LMVSLRRTLLVYTSDLQSNQPTYTLQSLRGERT
jgi:hypothetical protein